MTRPRITVLGSANMDLTVVSPALPRPGETVLGSDLRRAHGGKGANQAVAAARAGARVQFVGRVGEDDFGRSTRRALAEEEIDTDNLTADDTAATGVALIMVDEDGENMISVASGANARVSAGDARAARDAIAGADILLLQLEVPVSAVHAAATLARQAGVRVLLNPAPAPEPGAPADVLPLVDCLVPNAGEATALLGRDRQNAAPEELAGDLANQAGCPVVLTLGRDGVCVCSPDGCHRLAAPRVQAVDTVGAGDCFCGALAVALAEGRELSQAARFAQCAAALSVQTQGAQPSMPLREDINAFVTRLSIEDR